MIHAGMHVFEHQVKKGKGGHGFHHHYGPGDDNGVVASFDVDGNLFA